FLLMRPLPPLLKPPGHRPVLPHRGSRLAYWDTLNEFCEVLVDRLHRPLNRSCLPYSMIAHAVPPLHTEASPLLSHHVPISLENHERWDSRCGTSESHPYRGKQEMGQHYRSPDMD